MAEVTKEMIYDVLIGIEASLDRVEDGIWQTHDEVKGLCGEIAALRARISVFNRGIADGRGADSAARSRASLIDVPAT